jgi:hypothetical protein
MNQIFGLYGLGVTRLVYQMVKPLDLRDHERGFSLSLLEAL